MRILIVNAVEWGPEHQDLAYPKDVSQWIADAFGGDAARFKTWSVVREPEPPAGPFDAVVISGSPASAYDKDPWILRLSDEIRRWAAADMPTLGICFGHQILAQALGGRVEKNPMGWEVGVLPIDLTEAGRGDALFAGLPARFSVAQSHQDHVVATPPGAEVLASSLRAPCQAMRIGARIRSVQFHPEYTPEHLRFLLEPRRGRLARSGIDVDGAMATIRPTDESRALLQNFERGFIQSKEAAACSKG